MMDKFLYFSCSLDDEVLRLRIVSKCAVFKTTVDVFEGSVKCHQPNKSQ